MALEHARRENFFEQATAFRKRILLKGAGLRFRNTEINELFCGQKQTCCWSLYFDISPVLQFDSNHHLRRVYVSPTRLLADSGGLVELTQQQHGGRLELKRVPLAEDAQSHLVHELQSLLVETSNLIYEGGLQLTNLQDADRTRLGYRVAAILAENESEFVSELREFLRTVAACLPIGDIRPTSSDQANQELSQRAPVAAPAKGKSRD